MFPLSFTEVLKLLLLATLVSSSVWASPAPEPEAEAKSLEVERDLVSRAVTALSSVDISGYTSFTQFARAAYCDPAKVKTWTCGGGYFGRFM